MTTDSTGQWPLREGTQEEEVCCHPAYCLQSVPRPHRGEWKPRQVLQVSESLGDGDGSFWRPRQLELREEKYPEQELQRSAHQPPLKRVQKLADAREWTTRKGAGADITRAHTGLDSSCSCPQAGSPAAHGLGPGLNRLSVSSRAELTLHKAPLVPLHKVKRRP